MTAIQNVIRSGLKVVLVALMATLLTVMTAQVVMRYGFNSSLLWSEELCRYLLIWASFLAMIFAYERGELAALSILANALPRVPALLLAILGGALSVGMCIALAYYGYIYAQFVGSQPIPAFSFIFEDLFGVNAPEPPRVFWVYLALPLGMVLLAIRITADLFLYARACMNGQSLHELASPDGGIGQ